MAILISGIVYLYTLSPTVTFGDSGDFITSAYTLKFTHPPGYPTYVIIGKIFSMIPFGDNIGFRVNILSAFFAMISVGMTFYLGYFILVYLSNITVNHDETLSRKQTIIALGSLTGALTFAFNGTFWSQALVSKIHPLNTCFMVFIFYFLLKYIRLSQRKYWYLTVLLWGISLGIHHTSILYSIPAILLIILNKKFNHAFSVKPLFISISLVILGFSVYLLLPLSTPRLEIIEWGKADSWIGFKNILLRSDYGPFQISRSWDIAYAQLATAIWVLLTGQSTNFFVMIYGILIGLCALFGFSYMFQKNKSIAIFLGLTAIFVWIFFGLVNNHSMTRQLSIETRDIFFIPAYLIYGLFTGVGISRIGLTITRINFSLVKLFIYSSICIFLILTGFFMQYSKNNERNYYLAYDYGKSILDTMDKNSLFIGDDDMHVFPVWYLQQVENYRTDVIVLSRTSLYKKWYYEGLKRKNYPNLNIPFFDSTEVPEDPIPAQTYLDKQMFRFFELNKINRSCYFYQKYPLRISPSLHITQIGLIYQVSENPVTNTVATYTYPYLPPENDYTYRISQEDIYVKDFWRNWAAERLSDYHYFNGVYQFHQKDLNKALAELDKSIHLNPENYRAHYQIGYINQILGNNLLAFESYQRVLLLKSDNQDALKRLAEITLR